MRHTRTNQPNYSLDAFAKLRAATIIFVMSVCLSVRPHETTHWKDFHESLYFSIFRKPAEKIQVVNLTPGSALPQGKNPGAN